LKISKVDAGVRVQLAEAGDPAAAGQAGSSRKRVSQNRQQMWPPEISATPEEPVDNAKLPLVSTIPFPRSEIAATLVCLGRAYVRLYLF